MAAPAPHAGVALITALNILEGYNITSQLPRNSTYHWIAEVVYLLTVSPLHSINIVQSAVIQYICCCFVLLSQSVKIALGLVSGLGDPMFDTSVSELLAKMIR